MSYEKLVEKLRAKGWSEPDIQQAIEILSAPTDKDSSRRLYWVAILLVLIADLFISIVIVPILMLIKNAYVYLLIFIIALSFGLLFNSLLDELETFGGTYIMSTLFMPSLVAINTYFMFQVFNILASILKVNPSIGASIILTYSFVFLIPFIFSKIRENVAIY